MIHPRVSRLPLLAAVATVVCVGASRPAQAQHWPSEPVTLAGGHILVGGDVSATFGSADPGWFTYTGYETSALRRIRAGVTVEARPSNRISFLAEFRGQTHSGVTPYAWFVRLSPFDNGLVDIQAGRIPPVFGTYARRSYPQDNPLIGDPLGYQYLTTMRPEAIPATADDLLRMRGHGWLVRYPVGETSAEPGVPVIAAERWDTGVEVRFGTSALEGAVAYTAGTLAYPLVRDNNHAGQFAGRVAWRPGPALTLGVSGARGVFLSETIQTARPDVPSGRDTQGAAGIDAEASWGRWLLRGEFIANAWTLPAIADPRIEDPLVARTWYLETKIRLRPGLYVAARGDQLRFSTVRGSAGPETWDADVSRLEVGLGYTIRRGLLVKASVSGNWRDGGNRRESYLAGVQALYWF